MKTRLAKIQPQGEGMTEIREPDEAELHRMIAEAAYYRAEKRGFTPGMENDDWREAEAEVRARVAALRPRI